MPLICRERLARIQRVLSQNSGQLPARTLTRSYHVQPWEIQEAAALGWLEIVTRKPPTGRPSRIVREVSKPEGAKLPPYRWQIERTITVRQHNFAWLSTMRAVKGGSSWCGGMPCFTDAYQRTFPRAVKRRAAAASMSRLLRHPNVRAAQAWHYSTIEGVVPRGEQMPSTAGAIVRRLRELKSWRVAA